MTNIPKEWVCLPTSNHGHHYVLELPNAQMPFNGVEETYDYAKVLTAAPRMLDLCERALRALEEDLFPNLRQELRDVISQATGEPQ